MTRIALEHPERYWLALRANMPWLKDPDLQDRRQRWADRDDRDWAAIAAAVQHVMDELAAGHGRTEPVDEDDPDAGKHVVVNIDLDRLDGEDQEIVRRWFRPTGPIADPWRDRVENGRHRLWNSWKAAPEAVLPVYSGRLKWLDSIPYEDDDFAAGVYQGAMEGIELIPPTVIKRSPAFYAELYRVACLGGHGNVVPCGRWSDGDRDLHDELNDDPDLLRHILAALPVRRHDPVPPPGLLDVEPLQERQAVAPAPWWRRALARRRNR